MKALLRLAIWTHEQQLRDKTEVIEQFERAIQAAPADEKCYFYYARYLDALMTNTKQREQGGEGGGTQPARRPGGGRATPAPVAETHSAEYMLLAVRNYVLSLKHGHKMIYISLPRTLTLWFCFGEEVKNAPQWFPKCGPAMVPKCSLNA
jgi:serine/threonine-protein kinase ATR